MRMSLNPSPHIRNQKSEIRNQNFDERSPILRWIYDESREISSSPRASGFCDENEKPKTSTCSASPLSLAPAGPNSPPRCFLCARGKRRRDDEGEKSEVGDRFGRVVYSVQTFTIFSEWRLTHAIQLFSPTKRTYYRPDNDVNVNCDTNCDMTWCKTSHTYAQRTLFFFAPQNGWAGECCAVVRVTAHPSQYLRHR